MGSYSVQKQRISNKLDGENFTKKKQDQKIWSKQEIFQSKEKNILLVWSLWQKEQPIHQDVILKEH